MFIPKMNAPKVQRVNVPYLSGGINPGSVGEAVSDNQLTDCLNVWFKGGEVVTRPKLEVLENEKGRIKTDNVQSVTSYIDGKKAKIYVDEDFKILVLSNSKVLMSDSASNSIRNQLGIQSDKDPIYSFLLYNGNGKVSGTTNSFLLVKATLNETSYRMLFEIYIEDSAIKLMKYSLQNTDNAVYIPQVILNGWGNNYANLPKTEGAQTADTVQPEGYNRLTGAYKCTYTTDAISPAFKLPKSSKGAKKITVNIAGMLTGNAIYPYWDGGAICYDECDPHFYKEDTDGKITVVEEDTIEFNIPADEEYSSETYYVDGQCAYYSNDGATRSENLYYRCKFRAQCDKNGYIKFPHVMSEGENVYVYDENVDYSGIDNWNTDRFSGEKIPAKTLSDLGETELSGIDENATEDPQDPNLYEKITIDFDDAYSIYSSTYADDKKRYKTEDYKNYFPKLSVINYLVYFRFPRAGNRLNNLEVIVYDDIDSTAFDELINCNVAEIYGGTVGLNYGTRSFVSGYNHRIHFSDIDNPLYFPENCYIGVGMNTEKVTALAKQGGYLVIFKENSIYYTYEQEVSNDNLAEALANQSVVDLTAQYKYTVMTVNAEVGCNLPRTIQLCMNKLIFANDDGNVYVLNSLSNYSERNIFVVSGLIKDKLKKYEVTDWNKAFALDYQGYYMLFVDDMGFVLDYNRNAFKYVSSYTSDSNVRKYGLFSWWLWQFPKYLQFGVSTDTEITLVLTKDNEEFDYCTLTDEPETECESYIVSKFFDFSAPDYYKGIERLQLEFGDDYDSTVWVELLTDGGDISKNPIEIYSAGTRGTAQYSKEQVIYPKISLCRKFGFKITAEGPMALSSVIINYALKGSVKNGN